MQKKGVKAYPDLKNKAHDFFTVIQDDEKVIFIVCSCIMHPRLGKNKFASQDGARGRIQFFYLTN